MQLQIWFVIVSSLLVKNIYSIYLLIYLIIIKVAIVLSMFFFTGYNKQYHVFFLKYVILSKQTHMFCVPCKHVDMLIHLAVKHSIGDKVGQIEDDFVLPMVISGFKHQPLSNGEGR